MAIRRIAGAKPDISHDGEPSAVSQEQIADGAKMARSSLTKILAQGEDANPGLKSICQIAESLGVPPAFLLMRDRDWKVLAEAIFAHESIRNDPRFQAFCKKLSVSKDHSPAASVQNGRDLGYLTNYLQRPPPNAAPEIRRIIEDQVYRVGATSAAPPLTNLHKLKPEYVPLLLTLCAAMGAHFRD